MAETYPDCIGEVWVGLFSPVGVSPDISKKIQDAMSKTMQKNDVREKLMAQGLDLSPIPNNKLADYLKEELSRWAKIVKTSGATVD
jgi:tripartite-type tricarboxylate transporter receptor subunit TctC